MALTSAGMHAKGQSMTAAIAVVLGPLADPGVKLRVAIIMQWLSLACLPQVQLPGIANLWGKAVEKLKHKGAQRWASVRGPLCAAIAVLMDIWMGPTAVEQMDRQAWRNLGNGRQ